MRETAFLGISQMILLLLLLLVPVLVLVVLPLLLLLLSFVFVFVFVFAFICCEFLCMMAGAAVECQLPSRRRRR